MQPLNRRSLRPKPAPVELEVDERARRAQISPGRSPAAFEQVRRSIVIAGAARFCPRPASQLNLALLLLSRRRRRRRLMMALSSAGRPPIVGLIERRLRNERRPRGRRE